MRCLGSLASLLAVLVVSACGTAQNQDAQPAESLEPAPPIEAIDEPASETALSWIDFFGEVFERKETFCLGEKRSPEADVNSDTSCPSPKEIEALREKQKEYFHAIKPAKDSQPRSIARLRLAERGPQATATFVVWRGGSARLCTLIDVEAGNGGGTDGPSGPCVPSASCNEICLRRSNDGSDAERVSLLDGTRSPAERVSLLGGTVAARADALRVIFLNGETARYPLVGPLVPEFREHRVFMLDLGQRLYRRLELLLDGKIIAGIDVPREEIEWELCLRRSPRPSPSESEELLDEKLIACLEIDVPLEGGRNE